MNNTIEAQIGQLERCTLTTLAKLTCKKAATGEEKHLGLLAKLVSYPHVYPSDRECIRQEKIRTHI